MVIPVKGIKAASGTTQGLLKEVTQKKIAYLLSKHTIKDVEVYSLIKEFFKEYLTTNYEFTFDELAEELKKTYIEKHVKEALFKLLKDFSTIEYKDEDIPQEVLRNVLMTLSKLVERLIEEKERRSFFSRMFSKKEEKPLPSSALPAAEQPRHHGHASSTASPDVPSAVVKTTVQAPSSSPLTDFPAEDTASKPSSSALSSSPGHHFHVPDFTEEPVAVSSSPDLSPKTVIDTLSVAGPSVTTEASSGKRPSFSFDGEHAVKNHVSSLTATSSFAEDSAVTAAHHSPSNWTDDVEGLPLKKKPVLYEEIVFVPQEKPDPTPSPPTPTAPVHDPSPSPFPTAPAKNRPAPDLVVTPAVPSPTRFALSPELSFGPEEQALSEDLEKLAQELDAVIKDGARPAAQMAVSSPPVAKDVPFHHAHHPAMSVPELVTAIQQLIIESKMKEAHHLYKDLLEKYNALPEQEKHRHYDQIHYLYTLLQH